MKKILLFAAAAAVVFTSCMKGESNLVPEGETSIVVKIDGLVAAEDTRAVEAKGTVTISTLAGTNHYIYVLDEDNKVTYGEALDPTKLSSGQTIGGSDKFFDKNSKVYVLANIPSNLSAAYAYESVADFDAIKALTSTIVYDGANSVNTDQKNPAMANTTGAPVQIGAAEEGVATVNVNIAPLYSRIEFEGVVGGTHIDSYDVTGVWIDNFYPTFTLDGKYSGTSVGAGSSTDFPTNGFGDSNIFNSAAGKVAAPASNNVWAYHAAPAADVPTIIVRLENIQYQKDNNGTPTGSVVALNETRYITIKNFTTGSATGPAYDGAFTRGKIFQIKTVNFDVIIDAGSGEEGEGGGTDVVPNPTEVKITATVVVDPWGTQILYPHLGE
jgi:hypothetical protein